MPHTVDDESLVDLRCSVALTRNDAYLLVHRDATDDWVLPGGRPRPRESMASCARREVREETGLNVTATRCAFVLEVIDPHEGCRVVELIFLADRHGSDEISGGEPGLIPHWIPMERLAQLRLRPPIAGYLPRLARGDRRTAAYLGNLWRPVSGSPFDTEPWERGE